MSSTIENAADAEARHALRAAGVYAVHVVGGPGCGKSTLIEQTIGRLKPSVQAGAVLCDGRCRRDPEHPWARRHDVVEVEPWDACHLDPAQVRDALRRLDLASLDLLLVENVGAMTLPPGGADYGQDATVAVFSVAAGDDKARRHPELIRAADCVVLNKTDLAVFVPFDLRAFRADVARVKPGVELIELSALTGRGLGPWVDWLRRRVKAARREGEEPSNWYG
jgi:hydrogenase nickel incorporation protein HypB